LYNRTWEYESQSILSEEESTVSRLVESRSNEAKIGATWKANKIDTMIRRTERRTAAEEDPSSDVVPAYVESMSNLFEPLTADNWTDDASLSASIRRSRYLGFNGLADVTYSKSVSAASAASAAYTLNLRFPVSPDGEGQLLLTPGVRRKVTVQVGPTTDTLPDEIDMLGASSVPLLMPPFYYLTPFDAEGRAREYEKIMVYGTDQPGKSSIQTELSLALSSRLDSLLVPSRFEVSGTGTATHSSTAHSVIRTISSSLGRSFPLSWGEANKPGSLNVDLSYGYDVDYGKKLRSHEIGANIGVRGSWPGGTAMSIRLDASSRVGSQHIDDPDLILVPGPKYAEFERVVAPVPDAMEVYGALTTDFAWRQNEDRLLHREKLMLATDLLFPETAVTEKRLLDFVVVRFDHETEIVQSDLLSIHMALRADGGLRKELTPGSIKEFPFLAFELSLSTHITF
jgi:hypothetical protein